MRTPRKKTSSMSAREHKRDKVSNGRKSSSMGKMVEEKSEGAVRSIRNAVRSIGNKTGLRSTSTRGRKSSRTSTRKAA